jgi:translocation and assembly module TamB
MTRKRLLLWFGSGLVLIVLACGALLHWASHSEVVLRWGIDTIAARLPCKLELTGLTGSLSEPMRVERARCENEALLVEARALQLDWSPWELMNESLSIARLRAGELRVVSKTRSVGPPRPPEHLRPPLPIHIGELTLAKLQIGAGGEPLALHDLTLSYDADPRQHRLEVQSVELQGTRVSGELELATTSPFALRGRLKLSTAALPDWPIAADAALSGDLLRLRAELSARARELPLTGEVILTSFEPNPLASFRLRLQGLDLAQLKPDLPQTSLSIDAGGGAIALDRVQGTVTASNSLPGRLDQQRLPVAIATARFTLSTQGLVLQELAADLGDAGKVGGQVSVQRGGGVQATLMAQDLDLRALHARLRSTRLTGSVQLQAADGTQSAHLQLTQGGLQIQAELSRNGQRLMIHHATLAAADARLDADGQLTLAEAFAFSAQGRLTRFDPAQFGDFPTARLNGRVEAHGHLQPQWLADLRVVLTDSSFRRAPLGGAGRLTLTPGRLSNADLRLTLGGNVLAARGAFGATGDTLRWSVEASQLRTVDAALTGSVRATGTLAGTLRSPAIDFDAQAGALTYGKDIHVEQATAMGSLSAGPDPALKLEVNATKLTRGGLDVDSARLTAQGKLAHHDIMLTATVHGSTVTARLDGGWDRIRARWSGWLREFAAMGSYVFELTAPAQLSAGREEFSLGAANMRLAGGNFSVGDTRYRAGRLTTSGDFTGMRLTSVLALLRLAPEMDSDLLLGGRWTIRADDRLNGEIEVKRERGDIMIPAKAPAPLGLSALSLTVRAQDNQVWGVLEAHAGPNGAAAVRADTRLESRDGRWGISSRAPLSVSGSVNVDSLRPLIALFSRNVTGDGRLALRLAGEGTLAHPHLRGELEGKQLRIEHVENGVFLHDGTLSATLTDQTIEVAAFNIRGGDGSFSARGRASAQDQGLLIDLTWTANKLTAVQHPDLRLVVSGQGRLALEDSRIALHGELTADHGRVELRAIDAPALDDDVTVAGTPGRETIGARDLRPNLDLTFDLGSDFAIHGRGLDARLAGKIALQSSGTGPLVTKGRISTTRGRYEAYGQKLTIERGALLFAGPVDNPGLDIRAMRKNLQVEAGVEVYGTARDPRIRLVSVPDVPDSEKIAWLVLGRRLDSANLSDVEKLQTSATAIAAGLGTLPLQQQVARAVGLDELRFTATGASTSGAVALGKRVSERIYVTLEQSLSEAGTRLLVSYQLSRRWSVRTESGKSDAIDLFYTWSFD